MNWTVSESLKGFVFFASVLAGPVVVAPVTVAFCPEWLWYVAGTYAVVIGAIYYWAIYSER